MGAILAHRMYWSLCNHRGIGLLGIVKLSSTLEKGKKIADKDSKKVQPPKSHWNGSVLGTSEVRTISGECSYEFQYFP